MVGDRCWTLLARTYESSIVALYASGSRNLSLGKNVQMRLLTGWPTPWAVFG
jgi:hypothetical protein